METKRSFSDTLLRMVHERVEYHAKNIIEMAKEEMQKKLPDIIAEAIFDMSQTPQFNDIKDMVEFRIVEIKK